MLLDLWTKKLSIARRKNRKTRKRQQQVEMDPLESRLLLAAQVLTTDPAGPIEVAASSNGSFDVIYDADEAATGVSVRLHYNSSEIDFGGNVGDTPAGISNEFAGLSASQISEDTSDFDSDPTTDRFVNLLWIDIGGNFPQGAAPPVTLFSAAFSTSATYDGEMLNFTSDAGTNTFTADPLELTEVLPDPVVSISGGTAVTEGGAVEFEVSVDRTPSVGEDVTVALASSDETATGGADYATYSETLTFVNGGPTTQTITINTTNDAVPELSETFLMTLSSPTNATLGTATAQGTIDDDGDLPTVSIMPDLTREEGEDMVYTISLSDPHPSAAVSVDYTIADGTATAGDDYIGGAGNFVFAIGETTMDLTVSTIDDADIESTEDYTVTLSNPTNATLGVASVTGMITDNDGNGTISGRKYHDENLNGAYDVGEDYLAGWTIELMDDMGTVIDTALTDADGAYQFTMVVPGTYTVEEVLQDGWRQTAPVGALEQAAYDLDQTYNFTTTGNFFENWGGQGEKWLLAGGSDWFYILPNGAVYEWDGGPASNLSGTEVGMLNSDYHDDPSLLIEAMMPNGHTVVMAASEDVVGIDFGNYELGEINGYKFDDANENGMLDSGEDLLEGWVIELTDDSGNVIATATTDTAGEYSFDELEPGTYGIREIAQDGWRQTTPDVASMDADARELYDLDEANNFRTTANDFLNWGGLGEKWLQSDSGWHFITPDGTLYRWDMSPADMLTGTMVAELDPAVFDDLTLLTDPAAPGSTEIIVASGDMIEVPFGNTDDALIPTLGTIDCSNADGEGEVMAYMEGNTLMLSGDEFGNSVVVYVSEDGYVMVAGLGDTTVNGVEEYNTGVMYLGYLEADFGDGDDIICMHNIMVNNSVNIMTGEGNDTVLSEGIWVGRNMNVDTDNGDDIVGFSYSFIQRETNLFTGDDDDIVATINSHHKEQTRIRTGSGDDELLSNGTRFGNDLGVELGAGDDAAAALGSFVNGSRANTWGGDGFDAVLVDANSAVRNDLNLIDVEDELSMDDVNDRIDLAIADLMAIGIEASLEGSGQIATADPNWPILP